MNLSRLRESGATRLSALRIMLLCLASVLFWAAGPVQADAGAEAAKAVDQSTKDLVQKLNQERNTYYSNPDRFYELMEGSLRDVVDFERIAARVMGRFRRAASPAQQAKFNEVFKKSLFRAYGKTLVESGEFTVNVLSGEAHARDQDRANVQLEVISKSGNAYPVYYSMHRHPQRGWLLENVIVNGVNVGLAFRNKFEQLAEKHKEDVDKVIANWTESVKEDKNLTEAEAS